MKSAERTADIKATRLLRKHISWRQKLSLYWKGGFWVTSATNQHYWLGVTNYGTSGFMYAYYHPRYVDLPLVRLGAYPAGMEYGPIPRADILLGQKMLIECMEETMHDRACKMPIPLIALWTRQIRMVLYRLIRLPIGGGTWIVKS